MTESRAKFFLAWGIGAAAVAGVGLWTALSLRKEEEKRQREKKRLRKMVMLNFDTEELEIIKVIQRQDWNSFDIPTLKACHNQFMRFAEDRKHGILTRGTFKQLLASVDVTNPHVVESLFRFFDPNHDGRIDFVELVEGLNLWCTGTRFARLDRFFRVFDLDESGFISRSEIRTLLKVFNPSRDDSEVEEAVTSFLKAADSNHDDAVSRQEYHRLAMSGKPIFALNKSELSTRFLAAFGIPAEKYLPQL